MKDESLISEIILADNLRKFLKKLVRGYEKF